MVSVPASSICHVRFVPQAPEYNTVVSSAAGVVASAAEAVIALVAIIIVPSIQMKRATKSFEKRFFIVLYLPFCFSQDFDLYIICQGKIYFVFL